MRLIRLTAIAALIAAIATAQRPAALRRVYELQMDHESGGITCSDTRFYTGTDTGTMEERTHDIHIVDVRNVYNTASGQRTFNNETNRLGSFSQMAAGVANDVFYFCSQDDNAVYRYNTGPNTMDRIAGNGQAGLLAGTGSNARIDCGSTAVQSARDDARSKLYMFSGSNSVNYAIVAVIVSAATGIDAGVLSVLAGSGTWGHADGIGTAAQITDGHGMLYYTAGGTEFLVMGFSDTAGPIRWINIGTAAVSTGIGYSTTAVSGGATVARLPHVYGLVRMPGQSYGYGITDGSRMFTLSWTATLNTFNVLMHPYPGLVQKWGAAIKPNGAHVYFGNHIPGNGTVARLDVRALTITKTPPETRTQTHTITPPSRTIPETRTATFSLPVPPTPKPPVVPTPVPSNAGGVTTLAPGQTNSSLNSASFKSVAAIAFAAASALIGILA